MEFKLNNKVMIKKKAQPCTREYREDGSIKTEKGENIF